MPRSILGFVVAMSLLFSPGTVVGMARGSSLAELVNLRLGPEYSHWMVGPIGLIASKKEQAAFQEIGTDAEAAAFIERFWEARDPQPDRPGNPFEELFERRREQANRKFAEAGYPGWRSDRGTIWIVYGEPEETDYEISPTEGGSPIEVWKYSKKAEKGLDGERPDRQYRFIRIGDSTVFYRGINDPRLRPRGVGRSF